VLGVGAVGEIAQMPDGVVVPDDGIPVGDHSSGQNTTVDTRDTECRKQLSLDRFCRVGPGNFTPSLSQNRT
jgi:hypothetical protein